jgi:hypothetical protein
LKIVRDELFTPPLNLIGFGILSDLQAIMGKKGGMDKSNQQWNQIFSSLSRFAESVVANVRTPVVAWIGKMRQLFPLDSALPAHEEGHLEAPCQSSHQFCFHPLRGARTAIQSPASGDFSLIQTERSEVVGQSVHSDKARRNTAAVRCKSAFVFHLRTSLKKANGC